VAKRLNSRSCNYVCKNTFPPIVLNSSSQINNSFHSKQLSQHPVFSLSQDPCGKLAQQDSDLIMESQLLTVPVTANSAQRPIVEDVGEPLRLLLTFSIPFLTLYSTQHSDAIQTESISESKVLQLTAKRLSLESDVKRRGFLEPR